jgi:hypothetical protein
VEHEQRAVTQRLQIALEADATRRRRAKGSDGVLGRDVGRAAVADEPHGAEERRAHGCGIQCGSQDLVYDVVQR